MTNKDKQKYDNIQASLPLIMVAVSIVIFSMFYMGLKDSSYPIISIFSSDSLCLYISSFIVGGIVFIILRLFFMYNLFPGMGSMQKHLLSPKKTMIITGGICGIIILLLIHRRFVAEFHEYPARDIPYKSFHLLPQFAVIFLVITVSMMFLVIFSSNENKKAIKYLRNIIYIYTVFYVYYSLSTKTIDNNSSFDVYHGSAYIQSIYNALYYTPYDLQTTGVYGHYGIIYAAIMRLFRLKSEAVFTLIALAGAITTIFCIYIIHSLIKSDPLRIIAAISLSVPQALVYMSNYWMTYPHKTLFPMLLLAWLVFVFKHDQTGKRTYKSGSLSFLFLLTAYLISLVGIIWNTETGFYCLICTAAAYIIRDWQKNSWLKLKMLPGYLLHLVFCGISIAGAYGIVWLFNQYYGHKKNIPVSFHLKEFFFPLGIIDTFLGSGDHADIIFGNHAWIYIMVLFIISVFYAFSHTKVLFCPDDFQDHNAPVIAATGFLGIMQFALYFSHAAYEKLSMCHLPAVILIAYLCDKNLPFKNSPFWGMGATVREIFKYSFTITGFLTLTVLSAEVLTVGSITLGLQSYKDHGKSDIPHLAAVYNSAVPPDTFSIGSCVDILNYRLHQEPGAHYRDLSNLNLGGINVSEKIVNDALEQDYFAVWLMNNGESGILSKILIENPEFQLAREIDLGGYPLRVYSRIDELP